MTFLRLHVIIVECGEISINVIQYVQKRSVLINFSTLDNDDMKSSKRQNINGFSPVKLQIKPGIQGYAIRTCSTVGPAFGGGFDMHISSNAVSFLGSNCACGHTYHLPQGILYLILPANFMQDAFISLPLILK